MGTRGLVGVVIDGVEKLTYNHWDSYPSGLGLKVLAFARTVNEGTLQQARDLRMVSEDDTPTQAEIAAFERYHNGSVSTGETTEWYSLLRDLQGDLGGILEAGVGIDGSAFAQDSLFCEWGYVIDFDTVQLEAYRGFQTKVHADGRFAGREGRDKYAPIRRVASWPLAALPSDGEFEQIEAPEEEDAA